MILFAAGRRCSQTNPMLILSNLLMQSHNTVSIRYSASLNLVLKVPGSRRKHNLYKWAKDKTPALAAADRGRHIERAHTQ